MFVARKTALFLILVTTSGLAGIPSPASGTPIHSLGAISPGSTSGLLHRADTFPRCAKVRRCRRSSYGRVKCGYTTRCQECKYVKRCTRSDGCRWREVCNWGPFKPVLPTN